MENRQGQKTDSVVYRNVCNSHEGKDCFGSGECGVNGRRRKESPEITLSMQDFRNLGMSSSVESISSPSSESPNYR